MRVKLARDYLRLSVRPFGVSYVTGHFFPLHTETSSNTLGRYHWWITCAFVTQWTWTDLFVVRTRMHWDGSIYRYRPAERRCGCCIPSNSTSQPHDYEIAGFVSTLKFLSGVHLAISIAKKLGYNDIRGCCKVMGDRKRSTRHRVFRPCTTDHGRCVIGNRDGVQSEVWR